MKLKKLSGPRPVVLHNDPAFGEYECLRPIPVPERDRFPSESEYTAAVQMHGTLAKHQPHRAPLRAFFASDEEFAQAEELHGEAVARFEGWRRYTDTYDMAHLRFVDGAQPTVFMVGPLKPEAAAKVQDLREDERGALLLHLVAHAVEDIKNLEVEDEQGQRSTLKVKRVPGPYGLRLSDDAMAVFVDQEALSEVAAHVLASTRMPRGLVKSG
jgi:hypothetical protein